MVFLVERLGLLCSAADGRVRPCARPRKKNPLRFFFFFFFIRVFFLFDLFSVALLWPFRRCRLYLRGLVSPVTYLHLSAWLELIFLFA